MLNAALKMTERSQHSVFWHGALVKRGGNILAKGYNHGSRHAEEMAIKKLWPSKRVGTTVWSIRITKTGKLASSKPCPKCMALLRASGVRCVIYSTCEGKLERMKP